MRIVDKIRELARRHIRLHHREYMSGMSGELTITLEDIHTGEKQVQEIKNLVVTVGKNMVAQRLAGEANDCNITYGAVGTSATAPAVGDTTLGTELERKALAVISATGKVVGYSVFFGASEANGTLLEFGLFGEAATGSADSGTMFNHAVINVDKTSSKTMTISGSITVN